MDDKENLFKEFSEITKTEWIEKVKNDLKGKPFEDLFWKVSEDFEIAPFYHSNDLNPIVPSNKSTSNIWEIGEDVFLKDLKLANSQLLNALEGGVNAPRIVLEDTLNDDQFAILFEKVELSFISIHFLFNKSGSALSTLKSFCNYLSKNGVDSNKIQGSINHNDEIQLAEVAQFAIEKLPNFKINTITIEASASEAISKSLARAISKGDEYLNELKNDEISPEIANKLLQFSVAVGSSYFLEIAKIRALKILWANILEAYGLKNAKIPDIEAHLSPTVFGADPNTNMIRSTTQAMSAILGGVNRLTVLPSNTKSDDVNDFSRRIARNVQHLLSMESFLDRVIDPAKGSYYIEKLTEKIAETAWLEFQKMA